MHYVVLKTLLFGGLGSTITQVAESRSCKVRLSFLKKGISQKRGIKKENNRVKFLKIMENKEGLSKV